MTKLRFNVPVKLCVRIDVSFVNALARTLHLMTIMNCLAIVVVRLGIAKTVVLAIARTATLSTPLVVGIISAPAIRAQSASEIRPKFEVASIKPCKDFVPVGGRGGGGAFSPGRMNLTCQTVEGYIQAAYILFADGTNAKFFSLVLIEGGPSWINSDRYTITAKAENRTTPGIMQGPMLQTLLEDRFKLRIHRETREVHAYALTVAKRGPKLQAFKPGSCTPRPPIDLTKPQSPPPALAPGEKYCASLGTSKGPNIVVDAEGMSLDDFAKIFLRPLGRPVINKTGITGTFNFHLVYAPDEDTRSEATAPSIFTALQQQLGLQLESTKGTGEFLVIDHVEKPSGN